MPRPPRPMALIVSHVSTAAGVGCPGRPRETDTRPSATCRGVKETVPICCMPRVPGIFPFPPGGAFRWCFHGNGSARVRQSVVVCKMAGFFVGGFHVVAGRHSWVGGGSFGGVHLKGDAVRRPYTDIPVTRPVQHFVGAPWAHVKGHHSELVHCPSNDDPHRAPTRDAPTGARSPMFFTCSPIKSENVTPGVYSPPWDPIKFFICDFRQDVG